MNTRNAGPGVMLAALGGVLLALAVIALPWYSQDPHRLAPSQLTIDAAPAELPSDSLHAQAPPIDPDVLEDISEEAEEDDKVGAWKEAGGIGIIANLLILAAAFGAIAIAVAGLTGQSLGLPNQALLALGLVATVLVALRMLVRADLAGDPGLAWGIFVALGGGLLVVVGGFMERQPAAPAAPPPAAPPPPIAPPPAG